ncbi:S53 family peptidase [Ktedonosporobacter rubrisoli]|nr:S53 family peptidase [Ktedonosporobacter rubrisoli]
MRKLVSTSLAIGLIALLAMFSSVMPASAHTTDSILKDHIAAYAHLYLRVHKFAHNDSASGYTAAQLRKAYGVSQLSNKGDGVTIAVVSAYGNPNAQADLDKYSSDYGLPSTKLKVVYPNGKPSSVDEGWALETNLDLQMAHVMAPNAYIVLEAGVDASLDSLFGAVKDAYINQGADIVSMSFGTNEFDMETSNDVDGVLAEGSHKGISFTAASGDNGYGTQYPAASPYVTAVGGTTLNTKPDGTYVSESAWDGSSGGISMYENRPAYQKGFNRHGMRGVPDVAMVADPDTGVSIYDSYGYSGQKGYFVVGGTSAATPLFAGILALGKQIHKARLGNADTAIYNIARTKYASDFHDITSGSNGSCGDVCRATQGYDFVTGLGSPVANKLVPDLAAQ